MYLPVQWNSVCAYLLKYLWWKPM